MPPVEDAPTNDSPDRLPAALDPDGRVREQLQPLRGREPLVLAALLLASVGAIVFVSLAIAVSRGSIETFDNRVVSAFRVPGDPERLRGPAMVAEVLRDITSLGGIAVLILAIVAAAGALALTGQFRRAAALVTATGGGMIISVLIKHGFDRPRPQLVPRLAEVSTSSFPSSHSMMSAVVYLTLAAVVAAGLKRMRTRIYVLSLAVALTLIIAATRVVLGVHYPSDVAAGWIAGLVWALTMWLAFERRPSTT